MSSASSSGPGRDAVGRLHDGLDLLAELLVRHPEHRRIDELGVHHQQVLRLLRIDVHPARDDHERRPVREVDVTVLVDVAHVPQRPPAPIVGDRRGLSWRLEVLERGSALEVQLPRLTDGKLGPVLADHVHRRPRLADRSRVSEPLVWPDRRSSESLCPAVILVDDRAEPLHHAVLHVHRARGRRVDHTLETRDVVGLADRVGELEHPHEHSRHELRMRDAMRFNHTQHGLGVEPGHHDRGSADAMNRHRVVDPRRVIERRGRQVHARLRHAVTLRERILQHLLRPRALAVVR